jgi:hypothetical protein
MDPTEQVTHYAHVTTKTDSISRKTVFHIRTIGKLDMFRLSGKGRETPILLGPLDRANLNHWTQWTQHSRCLLPHFRGRKHIKFPKSCVFYFFRIPGNEENPETQKFLMLQSSRPLNSTYKLIFNTVLRYVYFIVGSLTQ